MRTFALALLIALTLPVSAFAASYQQIDGTIIDPIQSRLAGSFNSPGGNHPYSGNNLEPGANLTGANLSGADLVGADLTSAILFDADLITALLTGAARRLTTIAVSSAVSSCSHTI